MARRVAYLAVVVGVAVTLTGCAFSFFGYERRAAWHDQEERACLVRREVRTTPWLQPARAIREQGVCGIYKPLKVSAMADGHVSVGPSATLNSPMTAAVEAWLDDAVQPAAMEWFGAPVVEIRQISSYSCRPRNNEAGEKLSEHAYGNALDVAAFKLADGRTITVKTDWNGDPYAQGFLREAIAAACTRFKTVLGPGVKYHGDHFHLDLAHHNEAGTSRYCRPTFDMASLPRGPYSGMVASRSGGGFLDFLRTGSITKAPADADSIGTLLQDPPADIGD
jgi:hypothetical protein